MSKLKIRLRLKIEDFFQSIGKNTENSVEGILPTVFIFANSPLGTTSQTLLRLEIFTQKKFFCT